ncbi:MAG TPA: hypothetical protein VFL53_02075 [Pseudolabrys sp.]|nr:hypothetical protein [Pseudolabrys sp.]
MKPVAETLVSPEDHLCRAVSGASVEQSPFPHAFVSSAFPEAYYGAMLRHFPGSGVLVSNGEAGRGNQLQARFVFEIKDKYLNTLPELQREFWREFGSWILGETLRACILDRFSQQVGRRFPHSRPADFYGDAVLVEDHTAHAMGPHTDHPRKAVTLLFYLPADQSQSHMGTSIFVPKDRTFECSGLAHHSFEQFDQVRAFPFVPNALFMFAKTGNSFHGVAPVQDSDARRRLLMLNINVRN